VAEIDAPNVTTRQLTVSWPAANDNVGVIGYRIWLNGFEVATTAETRAQLRWFNEDSGQHVVQIRALDAAGNQSRSSPTLVVTRPSPEPTATPTPEPSDSPTPTDESNESSNPAAQSSDPPPDGESATHHKQHHKQH
jgi:ribulose bisphosphate carboxylase small subunit